MEEATVEYPKGEILFREGDTSKDLYILKAGSVKIFKTVGGKELPIAIVSAGQFIGELSFFDGKPRSATAQAATDVRVIRLDQNRLEGEIKRLPSWLIVLIKSIADRVRHADDLVKRNTVVDAETDQKFKSFG